MQDAAVLTVAIAFELGLFAAVIFAVFGIDDLAVDALALAGFGRSNEAPVDDDAAITLRFAIFIPAWREADVIGPMLDWLVQQWGARDYRVFVGVYSNDLATMLAASDAARRDPRIRLVINDEPGPTTKGGCLNRLWRALGDGSPWRADAVLIHDAEDVVDAGELVLLARALESADYAQIPVIPLLHPRSRWIGRHYCDEFAEAHGKDLPVRAAIGAPLPTAGVGCAFRVAALVRIADADGPFAAGSLTEDYELGLRLAAAGATGRFVAARSIDGRRIASRAYFPNELPAAVRQKTRWMRGIALDGWDRLGWICSANAPPRQRLIDWWMLWRDRRGALAAIAIFASYAGLVLGLLGIAMAALSEAALPPLGAAARWLVALNLAMLGWRLARRGWFTAQVYGWRHGLFAMLRQPVSSIILVMTTWRAILSYMRSRGCAPAWDATAHIFPASAVVAARTSLPLR